MTSLDLLQYALGLGSGVLIGLSLGLIGGGGSILAVPLLVYVVGVKSPHAAIGTSALTQQAEELRASGATALFVAVVGQPAGVTAIADPVKTSTKAALEALRREGAARSR
ncbi:MAG: hypothetical protein KGH91_00350 [Rhodospirillales bacterium]|nr:hypothetical protein [Rhodospirillales bacterium]